MEDIDIEVSAGCGSVANDIATNVINEVDQVLTALSSDFNIDVFTFYDDFIASGDDKKRMLKSSQFFAGRIHRKQVD